MTMKAQKEEYGKYIILVVFVVVLISLEGAGGMFATLNSLRIPTSGIGFATSDAAVTTFGDEYFSIDDAQLLKEPSSDEVSMPQTAGSAQFRIQCNRVHQVIGPDPSGLRVHPVLVHGYDKRISGGEPTVIVAHTQSVGTTNSAIVAHDLGKSGIPPSRFVTIDPSTGVPPFFSLQGVFAAGRGYFYISGPAQVWYGSGTDEIPGTPDDDGAMFISAAIISTRLAPSMLLYSDILQGPTQPRINHIDLGPNNVPGTDDIHTYPFLDITSWTFVMNLWVSSRGYAAVEAFDVNAQLFDYIVRWWGNDGRFRTGDEREFRLTYSPSSPLILPVDLAQDSGHFSWFDIDAARTTYRLNVYNTGPLDKLGDNDDKINMIASGTAAYFGFYVIGFFPVVRISKELLAYYVSLPNPQLIIIQSGPDGYFGPNPQGVNDDTQFTIPVSPTFYVGGSSSLSVLGKQIVWEDANGVYIYNIC